MENYKNIKCCKIVSTYFGKRRFYPQEEENTIEMLKDFVEHEKTIDPGVEKLDVIFVNHNCGNVKGNKFLDSLDGKKIYNGNIRTIHRPWDKGKGVCLGSFDYGVKLFKDQYDYIFLQEDDYKIMHSGYYGEGIRILEDDKKTAFVGYDMYFWENIFKDKNTTVEQIFKDSKKERNDLKVQLNILQILFTPLIFIFGYWKHIFPYLKTLKKTKLLIKKGEIPFCSGMMGLTKPKFLNEVLKRKGKLPFPQIEYNKNQKTHQKRNKIDKLKQNVKFTLFCVLGEMEFTRIYTDFGYNIRSYNNLDKLVFSYKHNKFKK
jgi:hypothetical protein|tara:strand:+ start:2362 stop:3312 length:951 start_codon:yes stop_codon:yes gene_type:complete